MKQCPTCREFYADKFGFCPVDGTQLNAEAAAQVTSDETAQSAPASYAGETETVFSTDETVPSQQPGGFDGAADGVASAAAGAGGRGEFHLTMLEDVGLTRRLAQELSRVKQESELTWPEFKRDPKAFGRRMATGYGKLGREFVRQPYVPQAIMAAFVIMIFAVGFIAFAENYCNLFPNAPRCVASARAADDEELELVQMIDTEIPAEQKEPDPGTAGMAKGKGGGSKPKQEKAGGGGGGGRQETTPASYGKLPQAVLGPQILPPNPHPPAI
ncbi:MAG TPA: hypothetical protein VER08_04455, partial [Pyrinomonadaceae bacterium]|nr:hypothetical protein [Pyrinomonadaceae bacterium]